MIPSPKGKKERPEIKITQPFKITAAQKALIRANQTKFSSSTMRVNQDNSILITKAVRMHSVMYAAHVRGVWDTLQTGGRQERPVRSLSPLQQWSRRVCQSNSFVTRAEADQSRP